MADSIKVLHLTTHNEECGIAKYQEQFVGGMQESVDVEHVFFGVSPNKTKVMAFEEYDKVLADFTQQVKQFDILHIQHELSFYKHKELQSVIDAAHTAHKKVIVTIHTALEVEYIRPRLAGLGPRSLLHFLRQTRGKKAYERIHLKPLREADLIIVHNAVTRNNLIEHGFVAEKIIIIKMPVPLVSFDTKTDEIKKALHYEKGDVIFSTVGFVTATKGVDQAVKALRFLPDNYKLAIVGGVHPNGSNIQYMNEICDYVLQYNLQDRVYITGYVKDDDRLNALLRETDICVYPYDSKYYSYVTSAALNNALANHLATIAYKTESLLESNDKIDVIQFCHSPNYYELAREIKNINIEAKAKLSKQYAEAYAYDKEAEKLADIYRTTIQ